MRGPTQKIDPTVWECECGKHGVALTPATAQAAKNCHIRVKHLGTQIPGRGVKVELTPLRTTEDLVEFKCSCGRRWVVMSPAHV